MLVKSLLGTLFVIKNVEKEHEKEINRFEKMVFYKQCFSRACNAQLFSTCFEKNTKSLISLWNDRVIGIIQSVDTRMTMFDVKEKNSTIIVNFCIHEKFRSYNVGTYMLRKMLILCRRHNIYIAIDKQEPYNNFDLLYKFYTKHNFIMKKNGPRYMLLKYY